MVQRLESLAPEREVLMLSENETFVLRSERRKFQDKNDGNDDRTYFLTAIVADGAIFALPLGRLFSAGLGSGRCRCRFNVTV